MAELKYKFPQGKIYLDNNKKAYLEYDKNFVNKFNNNMNQVQMFVDKTVSEALMPYVSLRTGVQEKSIKIATVLGSGKVIIGVPYAREQAYSPKIKKQNGKRGKRPFERMKEDKKGTILKQIAEYSKSINS